MSVRFREAVRADVPAVVTLLSDDRIGATRESGDLEPYLAAFERLMAGGSGYLLVGEDGDEIVATCQLTFIDGLSRKGMRRAQVESVRVAADRRGSGVGAALMTEVIRRSEAAGAGILQLTTDKSRARAQAFYDRLGFEPSHIGYKLALNATEGGVDS